MIALDKGFLREAAVGESELLAEGFGSLTAVLTVLAGLIRTQHYAITRRERIYITFGFCNLAGDIETRDERELSISTIAEAHLRDSRDRGDRLMLPLHQERLPLDWVGVVGFLYCDVAKTVESCEFGNAHGRTTRASRSTFSIYPSPRYCSEKLYNRAHGTFVYGWTHTAHCNSNR